MKRKLPIIVLLLVIMGFSGFQVYKGYAEREEQEELFRQLAETVEEEREEVSVPEPDEPEPIPEYIPLVEQNSDMVGWIHIQDTKIDYPVMQTKDSPNYYLRRNFNKEPSVGGCIYAQEDCDIESGDNVILYGHRMKNGSMFSALKKYRSKEFYEAHKTIEFNSLTQYGTYEIISVFKTTADAGKGFPYTQYVNMEEEEFNEFVSKCKELSLYDTGVTATYGDRLLTLSTCEYSQHNGRLVVVAVRR